MESWWLHDPSREDNLVAGGVVVCINSGSRHFPLVTVSLLAQFCPVLLGFKPRNGSPILKERLIRDRQALVIFVHIRRVHEIGALCRVPNLLNDITNFLYTQFPHFR